MTKKDKIKKELDDMQVRLAIRADKRAVLVESIDFIDVMKLDDMKATVKLMLEFMFEE
jgi:hypothetical protein